MQINLSTYIKAVRVCDLGCWWANIFGEDFPVTNAQTNWHIHFLSSAQASTY